MDEVDKIAKKVRSGSDKDATGEGVQQALLKIIEGNKVAIPNPAIAAAKKQGLAVVRRTEDDRY